MYVRRGGEGFSLLEVLVGLSVLALALGVLLQIFSSGLRRSTLAQEYTTAVLLAESEMARLGIEDSLVEGSHEDEIDGKYRRRVVVEPYAAGDEGEEDRPPVRPHQVKVEIIWGAYEGERSIALTTVRLLGER